MIIYNSTTENEHSGLEGPDMEAKLEEIYIQTRMARRGESIEKAKERFDKEVKIS